MGCGSSKKTEEPQPAPAAAPVEGQLVDDKQQIAPAAGQSKGKGKGGKGKGKGRAQKWQIMLEHKWQDYGDQEDRILKRAYMTGQKMVKFELRGQKYEYNFKKMDQINKGTGKERRIRPPLGPKPPAKPLLPQGPMVMITVGSGQPGTMISVKDPNNAGQTIQVFVPAHAKPGQKMAVPIPGKGESVEDVQKKQKKHDQETGTKGQSWSTGGAVAAGGAAAVGLAAVGVGGVILGDHLAGGDLAATIGEGAVEFGEEVADVAVDGADAAADWAADAGVTDWVEGAGEDIADFAGDAAEWFGEAGEDIGDFVMDLF